jgi:succinate-acetate transporter protein
MKNLQTSIIGWLLMAAFGAAIVVVVTGKASLSEAGGFIGIIIAALSGYGFIKAKDAGNGNKEENNG